MKNKYILLSALLSTALLTGCNDMLDIPQHGTLNYDTFYKTDEQAEQAVAAVYLQMRGLEYNYFMGKNLLSDDYWAGGGGRNDNAQLEQFNEFRFDADQDFLKGMFTGFYGLIYKANVVLGHVSENTEVGKRVRAEAQVFRAWAYFELTTLWENPPIVDHELEASEYNRPNATPEQLWAFIEKDLKDAIESNALVSKSNVDDKQTWRVTKEFAEAMLGKAYLWQKKYAESAKMLDNVIGSGLYKLYEGDYQDILAYDPSGRKCESIFESTRVYNPNNVNENWGLYHLMVHWRTDKMQLTPDCSQWGWGFCTPQKGLYDAFVKEEGPDGYRLNQTIKTYAQMQKLGNKVYDGATIMCEGLFMWKNRIKSDQLPKAGGNWVNINNVHWMRYAEVLLLAAEANLGAGNQAKADEYLNIVRKRAKLPSKSNVTLEDIQNEKRLELCGECVRFQDLLRWRLGEKFLGNQGAEIPKMDANGVVTYEHYNTDPSKYGFKSKHYHLPYPGLEVRLNAAIKQHDDWK